MNKQWLKARVEEYLEYQKTLTASDYARGKQDGYITALRLIEKLDEPQNNSNIDVEKLKDWLINNPYHQDSDYLDKDNMKLANVEETIKKIDEFTKKPVVPQFVADWIELCKEKADLISCLSGSYEYGVNHYKRITEDEDWLFESDHQEIVARAWLCGYEVEKEPLYCVKIGKGYFSGFDETKVTYVLDDAPGSLARRIKYDSKDEAEMDAIQIGGTVEEVAEG